MITLFFFLFSIKTFASLSKDEFANIVISFQNSYPEHLIIINPNQPSSDFWWNQDAKHASYSQNKDSSGKITHYLFFFGGLARMNEMTPEGAVLILCHELGHGIAGPPLKMDSSSSVEGQADYFATNSCLPKVLSQLVTDRIPPTDPLNLCQTDLCRRIFVGIASEIAVLRSNLPAQDVQFGRSDPTQVNFINTSPTYYPSNQCRLDTFIAGVLDQDRPRCWWKENISYSSIILLNDSPE